MPHFLHHIFVCENIRPADDLRGCCAAKGSAEIQAKFKEEIKKRGLKGVIRSNKSGCLDQCAKGPTVVVYPEGIWYGGVSANDVEEIMDSHIEGGRPVKRLLI